MRALLVGLVLSLLVAYPAYLRGSLARSGLYAALLVGTLVLGLGGAAPGLALVGFFVTSSLLSRHRRAEKGQLLSSLVDKGGRRDARQVLANGGAAALCCALLMLRGDAIWEVAALASLSAAAADTWATEIGVLAAGRPRMLLTLVEVAPGTSGAVSLQGLLGMIAGALFIALLALVFGPPSAVMPVLVGGILGGVLDSVLGQLVQERRTCLGCGEETEQRRHRCGAETEVTGGVWGLDNDVVNALATAGGALAAMILY